MSDIVNFSNLKRKEIRKTIGSGENPIIIYNPNPENRLKIEKIIGKNFTNSNEININPSDIILDLLPLCTNIILDLKRENKKDMEMIQEIINDPDPTFEDTIIEVKELIMEISGRYINTLQTLSKMPKEQLDKFIKESLPKETPEEKELRELKERQKELEDKLNKKPLKEFEE